MGETIRFPTREELIKLDEYKIVAYAARHAMRAFMFWSRKPMLLAEVKKAIKDAVQHAGGMQILNAAETAARVGFASDSISDEVYYANVANAARAAAACASSTNKFDAASSAVNAASSAHAAHLNFIKIELKDNISDLDSIQPTRVQIEEFEKLKSLPNGPLNCGPRGPLGPLWPRWKLDDWEETKLDFVYDNMVLKEEPKPLVKFVFDDAGFTEDEMATFMNLYSQVYSEAGGNGIKIIDGQSLIPDPVPAGAGQ